MEVNRTEAGGRLWRSSGISRKFVIHVDVGRGMEGYMEAPRSFHGIYSRKLQLIEAMEASGSTDNGSFHIFPRKDISTDFHGRFHGCTSMEAIYFNRTFHGNYWKIP